MSQSCPPESISQSVLSLSLPPNLYVHLVNCTIDCAGRLWGSVQYRDSLGNQHGPSGGPVAQMGLNFCSLFISPLLIYIQGRCV